MLQYTKRDVAVPYFGRENSIIVLLSAPGGTIQKKRQLDIIVYIVNGARQG